MWLGFDVHYLTEIKEISKLEAFMAALQQAQAIATAVEQEREKGKKRPKRYVGNSARTRGSMCKGNYQV
jgi:hypothetical protein